MAVACAFAACVPETIKTVYVSEPAKATVHLSVKGFDVATPIDLAYDAYTLEVTADPNGVVIDKSSADIQLSPLAGTYSIPALKLTVKVSDKANPSITASQTISINPVPSDSKVEYQLSMILGEPAKPVITIEEEVKIIKDGDSVKEDPVETPLGDPNMDYDGSKWYYTLTDVMFPFTYESKFGNEVKNLNINQEYKDNFNHSIVDSFNTLDTKIENFELPVPAYHYFRATTTETRTTTKYKYVIVKKGTDEILKEVATFDVVEYKTVVGYEMVPNPAADPDTLTLLKGDVVTKQEKDHLTKEDGTTGTVDHLGYMWFRNDTDEPIAVTLQYNKTSGSEVKDFEINEPTFNQNLVNALNTKNVEVFKHTFVVNAHELYRAQVVYNITTTQYQYKVGDTVVASYTLVEYDNHNVTEESMPDPGYTPLEIKLVMGTITTAVSSKDDLVKDGSEAASIEYAGEKWYINSGDIADDVVFTYTYNKGYKVENKVVSDPEFDILVDAFDNQTEAVDESKFNVPAHYMYRAIKTITKSIQACKYVAVNSEGDVVSELASFDLVSETVSVEPVKILDPDYVDPHDPHNPHDPHDPHGNTGAGGGAAEE